MSTNPRNRSTPITPPVPTEELEAMLTRLRLPAIRDRLDALLEDEVDGFYWTVLVPDIVNSGREEQGSVSV